MREGVNSQAAGLMHTTVYDEDSIEVAVGFSKTDSLAPCKKRAADA